MEKIDRLLPLWSSINRLGLNDPMIFLSGPRQVGKTFLSQQYSDRYYNWDTVEVKKKFLKDPYFFRDITAPCSTVLFDEIHKRRDWKKIIKGYYDSPERQENFLVTGSGRFNLYRKGGDSLQGRYFNYQLYPLLIDEIYAKKSYQLKLANPRDFVTWAPDTNRPSDQDLLKMGGFPSPFLRGSAQFLNKWNNQYLQRLILEDTRDFSAVYQLDKLELLARILPSRLTSPLSQKSLAEDLEVNPATIKSWLALLETLYLGFSIPPYHRRLERAVKKEKKWYFYQWTFAENPGAMFENYLAVQLAAAISAWNEQGFGRYELYYLRDQDRREVDFMIVHNLIPQCLIEAKNSPCEFPASLNYYAKKLKIPAFLIYPQGPTKKNPLGFSLSSANFLSSLVVES